MNNMNILFLAHRVPYPPDKGDRIRTWHLLKFLATQGDVSLATFADEPVTPETTQALQQYCRRVAIIPVGATRWIRGAWSLLSGGTISEGMFRSSGMSRVIRDWSTEQRFDAGIASASSVAQYLRTPQLNHVPAIVDLVDVDSQKWFDYAAASARVKRWLYRLEGSRLRECEQEITSWAQAVTLVSCGESDVFRSFCRDGRVEAVTNGVDLEYYRPHPTTQQSAECVFVGALDYRPNVDAAIWFSESIWPKIRARNPAAKFRLVGRRPTASILALKEIPGVEVIGQVADVRPYVASSAIVVAPLRIARGLQNKVLEGMAMGKPIVASSHALAGFRPGTSVPALRADHPEQWVDTVEQLLQNPTRRVTLGNEGREYAERYHNWDDCLEPIGELLREFASPSLIGAAQ